MKKNISKFFNIVTGIILATSFFVGGVQTVLAEDTLTEDIKSDSQEFLTNINTVSDYAHARGDSNGSLIVLDANDQYFEYTVNTLTEAKYNIAVSSGGKKAGVSLGVSVNGNMVLEDAKFPVINGEYGYGEGWVWQELGAITLSPGKNVIRFTNERGKSTDSVLVQSFRLTKYCDYALSDGTKAFQVNKNTVISSTNQGWDDAIALTSHGHYFDYEVYTEEALKANVSIVCGTIKDRACVSVTVNEKMQIAGTYFTASGDYGKRIEHELGSISLKSGKNIIRFCLPNGPVYSNDSIVANGFILSNYFDIDDSVLSKEFPTNSNTIEVTQNRAIYTDSITLNNGGDYFEYDVYVKNEGRYSVSAFCGTNKDGGCLSVTANDEEQIIDKVFPESASGYDDRKEQKLGNLNLRAGKNKLRFIGSTKSSDWMSVKSFKIEKNNSADAKLSLTSPTRLEVEDYTNLNVKDKQEASAGKWVCNTWAEKCSPIYMYIEAEQNGYYDLDYTMLTRHGGPSLISVYFDGTKIADNYGDNYVSVDEEYGKPFAPYATFNKYTQKRVYIEKGIHVIKLDISLAGNNVYKYMIDYLEFRPLEGYDIISFGAVTDDGARHPYAVRKGYTGYVKADILKVGSSQDTATVYLAEYSRDGRLVNVTMNKVDIAPMEICEEKEFMFPLTYTEDGGTVKAFMLSGDGSLTPLQAASVYEQSEFFPNAQEVMNEDTKYQLAKDVKDADGNYYEDCSVHDDKYDIDAIFYDSEVGDQSKVFAYIGVPKGASEETPVPAVVCIHGGGGMAFVDWVKLWNDKGYAAIAMTMTGDGPIKAVVNESTSGQYVGKAQHPYAGTGDFCWGDHAFDKDVKNASMYRNVLNVIRAHNVLRNYPGVDESKVGITGVSWGGITTTTTIGVDNRFAWAVPVYGTGYLDESETYFSKLFKKEHYAKEWDPANFAARSIVPTLYINSDSDFHFALTATTKTCGVTEKGKMSIRHNFGHSHGWGWSPAEIYRFADSMTENGTDPFIVVSNTEAKDGFLTANISYPDGITIDSVNTYYITSDEHNTDMGWKSISDYSLTDNGISVALPSDATYCYATIKDNAGYLISTRYVKVK